jgi:DNA repair exonuclease SbcCD ATPase subunit
MQLVDFDKIIVQNFLSVGTEPVSVDFKTGLHVITGINKDKQDRRNGVGKSTIADAIHFAIFGATIRDIKKENISNNLTSGTTQVELKFTIGSDKYKIVRTLNPSRCHLYINGTDSTRDSINNTTEYICKLLNTSQEIFQNCVIMTLNNTVPFMGKKKIDKRKFVEGIFGLEVFSQMLSSARADYNEVKKDHESLVTRHEEVVKNIASWKVQQVDQQEKKRNRIKKLNDRKESNLIKVRDIETGTEICDDKELQKLSTDIKSHEENIVKCEEKLEGLNGDKATQEAERGFAANKLTQIGTDKETCPVCLKPISSHDRDSIESEKATLNKEIDNISSNITSIIEDITMWSGVKTSVKGKLVATTNQYNTCVIKQKEATGNKEKIDQFHKWNDEVDEELAELSREDDTFGDTIRECINRSATLQSEIDIFKHKLDILDVIKFIVSEEGVKSYIVRKILQLFNSKLQYYLQRMDANCCCIFNEYFEDEIINEKNKSCSYHNFSGAERKNIDLACLFAFMDIRRLQGNVAYNFSIYDELLDSSLDERGVEIVLGLLQERVEKYNECVIIISHRKESVNIGSHYKNPGEVIFLEKEKGITRRVDYIE